MVSQSSTVSIHLLGHVLVTVLSGETVYGLWYINNLIHDLV